MCSRTRLLADLLRWLEDGEFVVSIADGANDGAMLNAGGAEFMESKGGATVGVMANSMSVSKNLSSLAISTFSTLS